jgi:hypothetical protein
MSFLQESSATVVFGVDVGKALYYFWIIVAGSLMPPIVRAAGAGAT